MTIFTLYVLIAAEFQPLGTYTTLAACEVVREQVVAITLDSILGRRPIAICIPTRGDQQ